MEKIFLDKQIANEYHYLKSKGRVGRSLLPVQGDVLRGRTAGADEGLVGGGGVGGHHGRVGQPTLLHGQGQVRHRVDVAAHVDLVSDGSLEQWKMFYCFHCKLFPM